MIYRHGEGGSIEVRAWREPLKLYTDSITLSSRDMLVDLHLCKPTSQSRGTWWRCEREFFGCNVIQIVKL